MSIQRIWGDIPQYVPESITDRLERTQLWWMYFRIKCVVDGTKLSHYTTPCGDFAIYIPTDKNYPERYEPELTKELCEELNSETVFYDIGSGFGYYIQLAKKANVPKSQTFGFEPSPERYIICGKNFRNYGDIKPYFVGESSEVYQIAIDEFVHSNPYPDVIKIDVEGGEFKVLKGAERVLKEVNPSIYVEVHPGYLKHQGVSPSKIESYLKDCGYSVSRIDHRTDERRMRERNKRELQNTYVLYANPNG